MRHRKAWIVGTVSLAIVVGLAAAGSYALSRTAAWVGAAVQRATGRDALVEAVEVDWSWTPTIRLRGLAVANPGWAEADHLIAARELRVRLRIPPLLRGKVELSDVVVEGGALSVERRPDGRSNWSFSSSPVAATAAEGAQPEERDEFPVIGRLRISDSSVVIRDPERKLALQGSIALAKGEAEGGDELRLDLDGQLAERPLTVRLTGGSVLMLRESNKPYPVSLEVGFVDTELRIDGTLRNPLAFEGAEIQMALSGPNLAEVFPLFRIPAPPSPPYAIEGRLDRDGEVWQFSGISGEIGSSDIAGNVRVDYRPDTPFLKARLVSRHLKFGDLAPLIGAPREDDDSGELFPDTPLDVERLYAMNMDVRLTSDRVDALDYLPITALDARVQLRNGRVEAKPLRFDVAGGTVKGAMALNGRGDMPSADADLVFDGLQLAEFFESTDYYETTGGEVRGRLYLLGSGRSLADVVGNADGSVALAMTDGAVSGLLVEAAGVDLTEALAVAVGEDSRVPIRCAVARLNVARGRAEIERAIMDTTDSVLYMHGGMDLRARTISLDIKAEAKDFSLLDVDSPVHVEGPISDPDFSLGEGAPIPFLEFGEAKDQRCDKLIEEYLRPPEQDE